MNVGKRMNAENMNRKELEDNLTGLEIAVIGMTGRFPGAGNIDDFWKNLEAGREGISFLSDEELMEAGIRSESVKNPLYIKACGWMEGIECFDASFFGYTPVEAEIMDPQIRILHECALEVLENAGYDSYSYKKPIGIYAGASSNLDWQARVELSGKSAVLGWFASKQLTDKDFMATRIAHRLNLKGPAITVDTACSTSLVAVHMACQGLLSGDCDIALAGGVSVSALSRTGYSYQEGMLNSPDGHCRAFDARAKGTNFGSAAALVVLKRLDDALADGDTVHAVVKGSAVNNDGDRKTAYTAPSIEGQAFVTRNAQKMAEVGPETVGYVEAHGTGTPLGDPVEIEGLKAAFNTDKKHFCRIGSVKTNVGHLESAAGIAGFIKTVLTLKHRLIPPSLFFEKPNPGIDFENSPFIVNKEATPWEPENGRPLRAGVSSFGIGGTNAHVVLEEWTGEGQGTRDGGRGTEHHLLVLSAKTGTALDKITENLGVYLKENPGTDIADVAYTLQVGRKIHPYRRMLVCSDAPGAAALLAGPGSGKIVSHRSREDNPSIVFMFPGQGAQYVDMGRGLYEEEPLFRDRMDRCFKLLGPLMEENLKEILYPPPGEKTGGSYPEELNRPEIAPAAIFIFEYALAELLLSWGIRPHAMIGYSFGEYAAACVSGVFSLEDALKLVVFRGKLIRKTPEGAMLSVPLSKEDLTPLLLSNPGVSTAIDNGPSCVVSGTAAAVRAFEEQMKKKKLMCMAVPVPHALHSTVMAAVSEEFEAFFATLALNKPGIPYISNVTGDWITHREAVDPVHWSKHLRQTVRFADGMKVLLKDTGGIFVEVGPGRDIAALTARHIETRGSDGQRVVNMVRHPHQTVPDIYHLCKGVGKLWLYGHPIDWPAFHSPGKEQRKRVPLPPYPFERRRFWIERIDPSKIGTAGREPDMGDWFYIPSWKRSTPFSDNPPDIPDIQGDSHWLIFSSGGDLDRKLRELLEKAGRHVTVVKMGTGFEKVTDREYTLDPREDDHYTRLIKRIPIPGKIIHLWGLRGDRDLPLDIPSIEETLNAGYYSLLNLARAVGGLGTTGKTRIVVVSHKMQDVTGRDTVYPEASSILGPVGVIPAEYADLDCRAIDIPLPGPGAPGEDNIETLAGRLLNEFLIDNSEPIAAYRDGYRWVRAFEPVRLESPGKEKKLSRLKTGGVYLITGGLGGIGLALAQYLAEHNAAGLVLTGRTPIPPRDKWEQVVSAGNGDNSVARKIKKILRLEEIGARVLVFDADAGDPVRMREVVDGTMDVFGRLDGVIHSAGVADGAVIQRRTREESEKVLASKIRGAVVLDDLLKDIPLDFLVYCSSIASVLPQFGQVAYCTANRFLDALAERRFRRDGTYTVSISWDRWRNVGIAAILEERHRELAGGELSGGISLEEGVETFRRIAASSLPRVVVSPEDLESRIENQRKADLSSFMDALSELPDVSSTRPSQTKIERPDLDTEYVMPRDETERAIVRIWETLLGFKRVGVTDDFIELGGDSLKAITMIARVHKELNTDVPLTEFFEGPTIRRLAEYVSGAEKGTRPLPLIPNADKKEHYALSSAQKRLFLLENLGNTGTAYNIFSSVNIDGPLDVERLEETFQTLVRRHESFRTSFHLIGGEPAQRIHRDLELEVEHFDLPGNRGETMEIVEGFVCPFDLARPPLLRVGLVKTGEEKHILMVNMHHIVSDGVSMVNFIKEFTLLYAGEPLPPLTLQYKDFSEWQNILLTSGEMEKQENYWLEQFKEEIPVLELPLDYVRPTVLDYEGEREDFRLEMEDTAFLKGLALEEKASLFIVLLAVYTVFISKLSGQEDIIVGVPIAGRKNPELEPVMGMFVNTLALRNFPSGEKSFPQFLKEVKGNSLRAFENQDYQFENLVENVSLVREPGRNPLFDTMFALQNTGTSFQEVPGPGAPELKVTPHSLPRKTSVFDLRMEAVEADEHLSIYFEYRTRLFKREAVQRFVTYFKNLLSNVRGGPRKGLGHLEIIPEEEKKQVLVDFNDTAADYPKDKTIHRLFEEQVEMTPGNIAAVGPGGRQLSYRELDHISDRLAALLIETSVKPGGIVGIMGDRSLEMLSGILAILKTGAAYLPIDVDYPDERIRWMLEDCAVETLLIQSGHGDGGRFDRKIFGLDLTLPAPDGIEGDGGSAVRDAKNSTNAYSPAYIMYTSGSTGQPKGVVAMHRNVVRLVKNSDFVPLNADTRILQTGAPVFDAVTFEMWGSLLNGGQLVLTGKEVILDAHRLAGVLEQYRINTLWLSSSLFNQLMQENIGLFSPLRYLLVGGDVLSAVHIGKVKERFPGLSIINGYGPTENTTFSTTHLITDASGSDIPIGKPISNSTAYIVDKYGHFQPVGIYGELCVGGDGLSPGYLNNPGLTAEKFNRSYKSYRTYISYRTGDLARWLPDGTVAFGGRIDRQVKIRGFRVESGEIETLLLKHNKVRGAVVIAIPGERGDKHLCAYIVLDGDVSVTELRDYLSNRLPGYMIPSYFTFLEKIPLTPNGKVDRRSLPAPEAKAGGEYIAPGDEIEEELAALWSDVLGMESGKIGIDDNFFELGGHSLKATWLVSLIHRSFDVEVPLAEIFKSPTIRKLSGYIKEGTEYKFTSIEIWEKKEYYVLSSAQKRLYILQQMNPDFTTYNMPGIIPLGEGADIKGLETTFKKLIKRHESLRTSFHMEGGEPVQKVHPRVDFEIDYFPSPPSLLTAASQFICPFDLSLAPLLRVGLVKTGEKNYTLLVDMHHIISDGESHLILEEDFMRLYRGEELMPLRIQYKDYAQWRHSGPVKERIEQQEAYWLKQFEGELPVLSLPYDFPRPALQSFEGNSLVFQLGEEETAALRNLAVETGSTLFIVLLSLFGILLSRLSGQEDIVVGVPAAGRGHADLEPVIGMFVNTLALRVFPVGDSSFDTFLKETKITAVAALENQEYQFEDLIDRVEANRDISRNPLFDVMLALQNMDPISPGNHEPAGTPGVSEPVPGSLPFDVEQKTAKFDLELIAHEFERRLSFSLEYAVKLFKPRTVQRYMNYFRRILRAVTGPGGRGQKLADIDILSPMEKEQLLFEFNNTKTDVVRDKDYSQLFSDTAAAHPLRIAAHYNNRQITYEELDNQSNRMAHLLRAHGVTAGSVTALYLKRGLEMLIAILGVFKAGGAYLPLEVDYPENRVENILRDSEAGIAATETDYLETLENARGSLPSLKHVVCLGTGGIPRDYPAAAPGITNAPDNLAYIIYTSGTTGKPKGVMIHQQGMINHLYAKIDHLSIVPDDTVAQTASVCFDISVWQFLSALVKGGRTLIIDKQMVMEPGRFLWALQRGRVTILESVPSLLTAFLESMEGEEDKGLNHLRWMVPTGEALNVPLVREWYKRYPGIKLVNAYGPTEASDDVTHYVVDEVPPETQKSIPIGKPLQNLHIYVLDRFLKLCPVGVRGEICVAGIGVGKGYWKDSEKTRRAFVPNPYREEIGDGDYARLYKTGDVGYFREDGNIECLGRLDNQVKIRGNRIELGDIENHLLTHPLVKEAVLTVGGKGTEKYLSAYIVGRETVDSAQLKEYLAETLPDYMLPSYFFSLEEIPLTPNGKVDRKALPSASADAAVDTGRGYIPPAGLVEKELVRIWSGILEVEEKSIGIEDSFFDLGGHSLRAVILAAKIHKAFDTKVPLVEIFKRPNIKELAEYVKGNAKERYIPVEPAEKKEYYVLSPAQKRLYILHRMNPDSIVYNVPFYVPLPTEYEKRELKDIIRLLLKRHESLRTSFFLVNNEPVQKIHPFDEVELKIDYFDLTGIRDEDGEEEEALAAFKRFTRPFDLAAAPLARLGLVKKRSGGVLMIDMHHIVTDEVSEQVFMEDVAAYMESKELPPLRLQYKDFAQWQNSPRRKEETAKMEAYWLKCFEGDLPQLKLPLDFNRTGRPGPEGYIISVLPGPVTGKLMALSKERDVTLFMLFLALYTIFLSRITGTEDIVVGTVTAGRGHSDLDRIIGMFVNTLAIRGYPRAELTFNQFLEDVKTRTLGAFENQHYPFEDLVDRLVKTREPGRNPLFDVLFTYNKIEEENAKAMASTGEVETGVMDYPAKFDIIFNVTEVKNSASVCFRYNTDLFKEETVKRLFHYLDHICAVVSENPGIVLSDIVISHELTTATAALIEAEEGDFGF